MINRKESAVSPVIGILLMLVVTIIIAAVVSGFVGGLGTVEKTPKVTLTGEYHQGGFMSITHTGGDSLSTRDTRLTVRLSNEFGDVDYMSWDINKSIILNTTTTGRLGWKNAWVNGSLTGITVFQPGDTHYIPSDGTQYIQNTGGINQLYLLNNTANMGKSFWLEAYDKSGKMITKTQVKILS